MSDHDPIPTNPSEVSSHPSVTELINSSRLEDAIEAVSGITYNSETNSGQVGDLKRVLLTLQQTEGGVKPALALVDALVPRPKTGEDETTWQKKYEASFYDYIIQDLVISALKQRDFDTAAEVVERMDDWYIGPAMGGGDLLELAYDAEDPAIMAAVWTLIKKHWGNGRAHEDVPKLAPQITDQSVIDAINGWLADTDIEYRIPAL